MTSLTYYLNLPFTEVDRLQMKDWVIGWVWTLVDLVQSCAIAESAGAYRRTPREGPLRWSKRCLEARCSLSTNTAMRSSSRPVKHAYDQL